MIAQNNIGTTPNIVNFSVIPVGGFFLLDGTLLFKVTPTSSTPSYNAFSVNGASSVGTNVSGSQEVENVNGAIDPVV